MARCATVAVVVAGLIAAASAWEESYATTLQGSVADDQGVVGGGSVTFDRVIVDPGSSGAVCIDGTSPNYYISNGFGDGVNKWYIHHQGGGWCESPEDCYGRSKSFLGSTKTDPPTLQMGAEFSNSSRENILMYNWNKVFLRYCDGGSFSGDNAEVQTYKGAKLHYRGFRVLKALIDDLLLNKGMAKTTDLVVGGCSAGGLATYLHLDWWRSYFAPQVNVVGLPDSGFFMDLQFIKSSQGAGQTTIPGNYRKGLEWVFHAMNTTSGLNQRCVSSFQTAGLSPVNCIFAQHTAPFITTPTFALQSIYDSWQAHHVLPNTSVPLMNEFGVLIRTALVENLLNQPQHGGFIDACLHHCGKWTGMQIGSVVSQNAAVKLFYDAYLKGLPAPRWIDEEAYPCASCCSKPKAG